MFYRYNWRMKLYSHYIAKQLVHATLLITVSLTSIVWLLQALRFIDFIVNQGVSIMLFLKLTTLLIPLLVLTILPPAFFCAILFTYSKLKGDSELVVMQAMGLDKWNLTIPALRVGFWLTIIAYGMALYIQPISMSAFREMQVFLRNNYVSILLQEGVFSSPVDGLTVFIRERHDDGTLKGILVHDSRKEGSAITMMADQGMLVQTPSGPRFLLEHGNRQEMKKGKLSLLNYDSYTLDISLYTDDSRNASKDVQEMFLPELLRRDGSLSEFEYGKRIAEANQRILWPAYIPSLTLIAMAFIISGQFSRRSGWKRVTAAAVTGALMLLIFATLKGFVVKRPEWSPLLYLWWGLPTIASLVILLKDRSGKAEAIA